MSWIESSALDAPPRLASIVRPLASAVGLEALPPVAHLALASCVASFLLQRVSSAASPRLFRSYYPTSRGKQQDWDLHMVSLALSLSLSCPTLGLSPSVPARLPRR